MTITFTKTQVRRAVEGALAAGIAVGAVEISPDGTIRIVPASKTEPINPADLIDMRAP